MTVTTIQTILDYLLYIIIFSAAFLFTFSFIAYTCRCLKDKQFLSTILTVSAEVVVEKLESENISCTTSEEKFPETSVPSTNQSIKLPQDWQSVRRLAQRLAIPRWNRMKRPELEVQLRLVLSRT